MSELRLKGTKTRNSVGLVKYKVCSCGKKYQVRRGRNNRGVVTTHDPKQCGQHLSMRTLNQQKDKDKWKI
jgi:hypothetical protein